MNRSNSVVPALLSLILLPGALAEPCGAAQEWASTGDHIHSTNIGTVGIGYVPTDADKYKLGVINPTGGGIVGNGQSGWEGVLGVGQGSSGVGVKGISTSGRGVVGDSYGGIGVHAVSDGGIGLKAECEYGTALYASSYDGLAGDFQGNVDINGSLKVGALNVKHLTAPFVGVGRNYQITSAEVFGTYADTNGYSGMYVATSGQGGDPFYGYAAGGNVDAYHLYEGNSGSWRLYVGSSLRLAVTNTGKVGVGLATPAYKLHVNGSAGKPGGGSWSNASDLRLKKNVQDLTGSLDKLLSLRGVTYEYKEPEVIHELPGTHTGVVAQEVEQVFPEWVDEAPDGFKRVTFRGFEALTVEALRELERENNELRQESVELKQRMADLEAVVATLANQR